METRGREVSVREVLDEAAIKVKHELTGQPEVAAAVHTTIGQAYYALGRYPKAQLHLKAALEMHRGLHGAEHQAVAKSMAHLADVLRVEGDFVTAESLCREALAMSRRLLGDEHEEVARIMDRLADVLRVRGDYDGSERLCREALAIRRASL